MDQSAHHKTENEGNRTTNLIPFSLTVLMISHNTLQLAWGIFLLAQAKEGDQANHMEAGAGNCRSTHQAKLVDTQKARRKQEHDGNATRVRT
jgi:hypothetical protein